MSLCDCRGIFANGKEVSLDAAELRRETMKKPFTKMTGKRADELISGPLISYIHTGHTGAQSAEQFVRNGSGNGRHLFRWQLRTAVNNHVVPDLYAGNIRYVNH